MELINKGEHILKEMWLSKEIDDYIFGRPVTMLLRGARSFDNEAVNLYNYRNDGSTVRYQANLRNYKHFRFKDLKNKDFKNHYSSLGRTKADFIANFASTTDPREIFTLITFTPHRI